MGYNFNKKVQKGKFEISIDSEAQYGYFEHDDFGEDCGGGLWFENNTLVDYDGIHSLPNEVAQGIRELGFKVDTDICCD